MADAPKVSVLLELVDRLTAPINGIEGRMKSFGNSMSTLGKTIAASLAAVAIGDFFKSALEEGIKAETGMLRLRAAVLNAGGSFDSFKPKADEAVKAVMRLSTATDDDLNDALTRMITISGDTKASLGLLQTAADLAAYKHIGLGEAADAVGKAMTGNTKALKQLGITSKDSGDALDELRAKVGGFASVEAQSFGGALQQIANWWGEFKESIGTAIMSSDAGRDSLGRVRDALIDLGIWIEKNTDTIGGFVSGLVNFASFVGSVLTPVVKGAATLWLGLRDAAAAVWKSFDLAGPAISRMAGFLIRGFGSLLANIQPVLKVLGLGDLPLQMQQNGQRMISQAEADQRVITASYDDATRKRVGIVKDGEERHTGLVNQHTDARAKKIKDTQKEIDKALLDSANLAIKASVSSTEYVMGRLNDHGAAAKRLKEKLDELKKATDDEAKADADAAKAAESHADKVQKQAGQIKDLADRLADVAYGVGLIDEKSRVAIGAVADLGKAFTDIVTGTSTGDILSGITGVIGAMGAIAKSLFGGNQELRDQLAKNSVRLEQLRTTMGDLLATQLPGRVVDAIGRLDPSKMSGWTNGSRPHGQRQTNFMKMLHDAGLSMADIDQLAKDWNFPIRTSDGTLNLDAVKQLITAVRESDTAVPANFKAQKSRIETGKSIGSVTDPIGEAVALVTDTTKIGSPAIRDALAGLGLDTKDGRGQAIANLRALYNKAAAGKLQRSDFGGMSQSDFFDAIQWLIDMFSAAGATNVTTPDTPGTGRNPGGAVDTGTQIGGGPDVGPNGGGGISASVGFVPSGSVDFGTGGVDWQSAILDSRAYLKTIADNLTTRGAVAVGDINVTVTAGEDAAGTGAAIATATLESLDELLQIQLSAAQARTGSVVRS